MISDDEINPILGFVLYPKKTYQNMYDIMMNAYVYQRINPQTPKKDIFFTTSKEMYTQLLPDVKVANFSGKERKNQFVLLAQREKKFDARNMSSGEKLIWYSLLILNYIKNLGVLIIDEPENHLHEQLAWKYITFLKKMSYEKKNFKLEQVFLLTHAKNFIYNNFAEGNNYVINSNGDFNKIQKEECEDILRSCGISYIDDKVLFVEGKTEIENLSTLCERNNIRIRQLANCTEIIQVYESLIKVKELIYAPKFMFVIDRDTRNDDEIISMEQKDEEFFEKHFAVLPVHEFENFLLDEKIVAECVNKVLQLTNDDMKTEDEIKVIFKKYADENLPDLKKKYLNNAIRKEMKCLESLIKKKEIIITDREEYESYIDFILSCNNYEKIITRVKDQYNIMMEKYDTLHWESNWKQLCDGKIVLNKTLAEIEKDIRYGKEKLFKMILDFQLKDTSSELYRFWNGIIEKLI